MRAVQIEKPGSVLVGELPDPRPGVGEVLVGVAACGVCGTDLHIADGEFAPTPYPIVPGHEFAGTVLEVGPEVRTGLAVGSRVAVDPSLFCGHCAACRAGRGNLCANWGATGDTVDGAFAEQVTVPATNAYPIPDTMSYEQGALVEPLSCAVHGLRRLGVEVGESVLVVGTGTMGLLLVQLLERAGAQVVAVDRVDAKAALAESMGARRSATSIAELDGEQFDAVVDVTGVPAVIEEGIDAVRRGGRFLVFGVAPSDARVALSPFRIYNDEITVVGSMAVLHSFGTALGLIAGGVVRTDDLVSHRLPLEEYEQALEIVRGGAGVKVHVVPGVTGQTP
ncbi:MAG TPA: zinc-dependent alcohol dehydrogenase family protein [Nocardioidaceae bacterium]|nr:zinc-dependent alcohol dehydrogenase family protein [Nocardioidaceae bacterium]